MLVLSEEVPHLMSTDGQAQPAKAGAASGQERPTGPHVMGGEPLSEFASALASLPLQERQARVQEMVLEIVRNVGAKGGSGVGVDEPLMEAGIDSLGSAELSNKLHDLTSMTMSPTLIFEHPTSRGIAAHVLGSLSLDGAQVGRGRGGHDT